MDKRRLFAQRRRNFAYSALILTALSGLLAALGWVVAGIDGVLWTIALGIIALVVEQGTGAMALRRYFGARPIPPQMAPKLHAVARELARRAGLARAPRLHYIPSPAVQALATGSTAEPALALTDGILRLLSPRELAAVVAHEIWHIRQHDLGMLRLALGAVRLSQALCLAAGALVLLYWPYAAAAGLSISVPSVLMLMLAPSLGLLLWLGLSRTREFDADAGAAALTGDPEALASALARLERAAGPNWERLSRTTLAASRWLRTHPSAQARIARLRELTPPPLRLPSWPLGDNGVWRRDAAPGMWTPRW